MTSKHLFLKGMKEDLRHKVWMLALSLLGNFLAMPVLWLLNYSDVAFADVRMLTSEMTVRQQTEAIAQSTERMMDFCGKGLVITASIIAILGAVVVGLECFHYLQQKSMVDTYHSLPVGKTQLFGIKYINGLLIWLIPYLFCTVLTLVFAGILLARVGGSGGIPGLILEAAKNTAVLVVVFLLIYHLLLLATMLTGNMLNTLAVASILGCGVIAAYGLTLGFTTTFFHTHYAEMKGLALASYGSPLAAPFVLLGSYIDNDFRVGNGFPAFLPKCLAMALALGALAWLAYLRRPSERAGRGLTLWWVAGPFRFLVSVLGGMSGWVFMYYLMSDSNGRTVWSLFGALLGGILCYGVSDVVFSMDFKAFFRHKWGMGMAMGAALVVCVGFQGDWMGYDRYLPDQEQIVAASIACRSYGNYSLEQMLYGMEFTDAARIYDFLERGVENAQGRTHSPEDIRVEEAYSGERFDRDNFAVRVMLDNGDSYTRRYSYYEWDADVVLPLLCSKEYADAAYYVKGQMTDNCTSMRFSWEINGQSDTETDRRDLIREVAEAYNQDLMENPQAVILGEGRVLGQIAMRMQGGKIRYLYIMDHMSYTLKVLEESGILTDSLPFLTEDVTILTFNILASKYWYRGDSHISPAERCIRSYFGVYPESLPDLPPAEAAQNEAEGGSTQFTQVPSVYSFSITDPEEIAELLPLIQFGNMSSGGVFTGEFVTDICIGDDRGTEWNVCMRSGTMPEKYIRRFLEYVE